MMCVCETLTNLLCDNNIVSTLCSYATIAKRVNVKKLKTDIWAHIDELPTASSLPAPANEDTENTRPSNRRRSADDEDGHKKKSAIPDEAKMSFQDLVRDISVQKNQKDATLPFYFICLLHLANEKVTMNQ
jgi:condensin complex subunit 2